jgi:hypothetical protein
MKLAPGTKRGLLVNACIYGVAVVFTVLVLELSNFYDYKRWALQSISVYSSALLLTLVIFMGYRYFNRGDHPKDVIKSGVISTGRLMFFKGLMKNESFIFYFQVGIALIVFIGTLVIPLTYNVVKLDQHTLPIGQNGKYVQPEVQVIEVAGKKLDHGKGPYATPPKKSGTSLLAPPKALPVNDYFAYLPGMSFFGVVNTDEVPKFLSDSRWYFTLFGLVGFGIAVLLLRKDRNFKLSCFVALVLLPTATLTLATGGDDIPVIAFMILSAVLLNRNKVVLSGLSLGFAMSLKFTAWIMFAVLIYTAIRKYSKGDIVKFFSAILVILTPILLSGIYNNLYGFITNAIRFPLGLAGTSSPADSALPGHLITSHFSHYKGLILLFLVLIFFISSFAFFIKCPPKDIYSMLFVVSFVMTAAIALAPNTRFGYLNYPVDLAFTGFALYFENRSPQTPPVSKIEETELASV